MTKKEHARHHLSKFEGVEEVTVTESQMHAPKPSGGMPRNQIFQARHPSLGTTLRKGLTPAALDTHLRSALNASDFDKTHQSLEQRFETYPALAQKLANYMAMEQRKASYVADDEAAHVTAVLKKVVDASKMTAELRLEQLNAEVLVFRQTNDMTTAEYLEEAEEKHETVFCEAAADMSEVEVAIRTEEDRCDRTSSCFQKYWGR